MLYAGHNEAGIGNNIQKIYLQCYLVMIGWDLAEWFECLTSHATALGSILAFSDTHSKIWGVERKMKQCWTKYFQNPKKPLLMIFKSWSSRIISGLIGELFVLVISVHCFEQWTCIMRPKARGLVQHGGPPGRAWGEWPGRCDFGFWTLWTGRTARLFRTVPVALTGAAQLRADRVSSCCYIVNVNNHPSWATSRKGDIAWYSGRLMSSLWLWLTILKILRTWGKDPQS